MTREHKLSLIIGFAMVLIVGILMSDHLSGAREAKLVEIELPEESASPIIRRQTTAPMLADAAPTNTRPADRLTHIDDTPSFERFDAPEQTLASADEQSPTFIDSVRENVNNAMSQLRNGNGPRPALQTETITMGQPIGEPEVRDPESKLPVRVHIVRRGETLWSIAERYYGTGFVHEDLLAYNRSRVRTVKDISPGLNLLIPDRSELGLAPRTHASNTQSKIAPPAAKMAPRSYTVRKGDTLSEISQKLLGTSKRWEEILALNDDKLDEATDIAIGMTLKIPAR